MTATSRPRRQDPAADLRERIAEKVAGNRRLALENQRLQAELRRANAQEVIADSLHHARVDGHGRTREAGLSAGFCWNTSPAIMDSPSSASKAHVSTIVTNPNGKLHLSYGKHSKLDLGYCEAAGPSALGALRQQVTKAQAEAGKLAEEAEALRARVYPDSDLEALKHKVVNLQSLIGRHEKASLTDDELSRLSDTLPHGSADMQHDRKDDDSCTKVLKKETSFEMLSTPEEMEQAEIKKALHDRLAALNREIRSLQGSASGCSTPADRHRQRRLQQAHALAAGMHQELRRSAGSGAMSPRSTSDAASNISPVTQRSSEAPSMISSVAPSMASSAGKAFGALRVQRLDRSIQQLSRRFALRAAAR